MLFSRLEGFANLGDALEDFRAFFTEYPSFQPVQFYDFRKRGTPQERQPVVWRPEFHRLSLEFRDMLREVWMSGRSLGVLLGTDAQAWKVINRSTQPTAMQRILDSHKVALQKAMRAIPTNYFAVPSEIRPDWRAGSFQYEADTDFRRAVYLLFKQSWRAKACLRCGRYFIADKPPQLYCSTKCYGQAKQDRDRDYWRNVGSERREHRLERQRKGSPKQARRKRQ